MMGIDGIVASHTSLMVEDVDASVDYLERTLGLSFRSPARIPFEISEPGGSSSTIEVRACYSVDGTLELAQVGDDGPFARSVGFGLHHFGGVVDDIEAAVEAQRAAGNEVAWELSFEDQLIA